MTGGRERARESGASSKGAVLILASRRSNEMSGLFCDLILQERNTATSGVLARSHTSRGQGKRNETTRHENSPCGRTIDQTTVQKSSIQIVFSDPWPKSQHRSEKSWTRVHPRSSSSGNAGGKACGINIGRSMGSRWGGRSTMT